MLKQGFPMADKQFLNLYSVSFKIGGQEYGHLLDEVLIKKKVTKDRFVEDKYVFRYEATDLLSKLFAVTDIEISLNQSSVYKTIYKNTGFISKAQLVKNKIVVFIEMQQKPNFLRKNGVSITAEHITAYDALKKYVEKIDTFYKHKYKTQVTLNYDKNLNKFKYPALLFPIKDNHFKIIQNFAKNYFILNAPYYLFFDDYSFTDKQHPVSLNLYDLSNIKALRAVMASSLNTNAVPLLQSTGNYFDGNVLYNVDLVQKISDLYNTYSMIKPSDKLLPENRFVYNSVLDNEDNVAKRQQLTKEFYSKSSVYHKYNAHDIDITKLNIGFRYVDDISEAKIQYTQAIIEVDIRFVMTGAQDTLKNKNEFINQAVAIADFKTISY